MAGQWLLLKCIHDEEEKEKHDGVSAKIGYVLVPK